MNARNVFRQLVRHIRMPQMSPWEKEVFMHACFWVNTCWKRRRLSTCHHFCLKRHVRTGFFGRCWRMERRAEEKNKKFAECQTISLDKYAHAHKHTHACTHTGARTHTYTNVYTHSHVNLDTHTHKFSHTHTVLHTQTQTHCSVSHTYTYSHTHAHTWVRNYVYKFYTYGYQRRWWSCLRWSRLRWSQRMERRQRRVAPGYILSPCAIENWVPGVVYLMRANIMDEAWHTWKSQVTRINRHMSVA